jgi:hypothetical protein
LQRIVEYRHRCAVLAFGFAASFGFDRKNAIGANHNVIDVSHPPRFIGDEEIVKHPIPGAHQLIERFADLALALETEANASAFIEELPQPVSKECGRNDCDSDENDPHGYTQTNAL